ncbi:MAG TPA: hypothetical protein PLC98_03620 [Anaerolineales bacterium]|nr:hypothetical protein [Anaerolineales bacterium]
MKEQPILFSAPMVHAILEDFKDQTRRVVTHPKWADRSRPIEFDGGKAFAISRRSGCLAEILCPYGFPGNSIWVKETWGWLEDPRGIGGFIYKADGKWDRTRWHPSIFMPRAASRITLEIESVRLEQLQCISESDAIDEGAPRGWYVRDTPDGPERVQTTYRAGFAHLWDEINAERGYAWSTNPWVWAIAFRRANSRPSSKIARSRVHGSDFRTP